MIKRKEGSDYIYGDDLASINLSRICKATNNIGLQRTVSRFMTKQSALMKAIVVPEGFRREMYNMLRARAYTYLDKNKTIQKYPDVATHAKTATTTHLRKIFLKNDNY